MAVSKGAAPRERASGAPNGTSPARTRKPSPARGQSNGTADRLAPGLVGARIRDRRLAHGISLRQFARDLDVSASFISQLETGKTQPSVATLFAICAALDIATDELFDNHNPSDETVGESNGEGTDAGNNAWRTTASFGSHAKSSPSEGPVHGSSGSSPLVHPGDRKVLVLDSGVTWESLTSTRNAKTDFMFVRYDVGGSSTIEDRLIRHVGTEYGYILSGTLEVTLSFETYRLNAGDSISFDSSRPHRLANVGDVPVEAIWVNLEFLHHD
jgi:transcriptional regulator with XRE-family HTH domain/mannose-6-phosphate isomerase-like protein (cupin superfamily)